MVQFRFAGEVTYEGHESDRQKLWDSLNPAARGQFFYSGPLDTSTQGVHFQAEAEAMNTCKADPNPPENFALGVLFPTEVCLIVCLSSCFDCFD